MTSPARLAGHLPDRLLRALPVEVRADARDRTGRRVPGDLGYEPTPPTPQLGERTGPPDFILLGGDDTGGRWWMSLLADHPEVAPNRVLDEAAHVFAPYATDAFDDAAVARFHALFPRRAGRVIGHWGADALARPWVPALLARAAPRAQVLVLVRDPVERLLTELAATADERPPHVGSHDVAAVDHGFVGDQLTRLLTFVPTAQVRVLQYERCVVDPRGALAESFAFLGVDDTYRPGVVPPPLAADGPPVVRPGPEVRERLARMYADDVAVLAGLAPDLDLGLWPNFAPDV